MIISFGQPRCEKKKHIYFQTVKFEIFKLRLMNGNTAK
jgi:hypothetical protein